MNRFSIVLIFCLAVAGCAPPAEKESPSHPVFAPMTPQFSESINVILGDRYDDVIETQLACNPTPRLPLTVKMTGFKSIAGKGRWYFHVENLSTTPFTGDIRVFLLFGNRSKDTIDKHIVNLEPSSTIAPGYGVPFYFDSDFMPQCLHGDVDGYGWALSP